MKNGDQVLQPGNSLGGWWVMLTSQTTASLFQMTKRNIWWMQPLVYRWYQMDMEDRAFERETSTHNSEKA